MANSIAIEVPSDLIQQLHQASATGGSAIVPADRRAESIAWLTRALLDFESLKRHIDLLSSLHSEPFRVPQPRRDSWIGARPEPPQKTAFRFSQPLPDELVVRIMDDGVACLDATQLGELLLNPYALYDLHDVLDDTLPAAWLSARATETPGSTNPLAAEVPPSESPNPGLKPARARNTAAQTNWLAPLFAAAACLVIGVTFGMTFRTSGSQGPFEVVSLNPASVKLTPTRGAGESQTIVLNCERKGFASIIALDEKDFPFVFPGAADAIPVQPGKAVESPPLPPRLEGSLKLVVITEQPAGGVLHKELEGKRFTADQISQLQTELVRIFREHNYRWVAFALVKPAP
jgi:hypothetical protein